MRFWFYILTLILPCLLSAQKFDIYFDFNKDVPNAASAAAFESWIAENPTAEILKLEGYTDSVDANSYNKELSVRRIESVLQILQQKKIKISSHLVKQPYGENFEASSDQSSNRRVTLFYQNPENAAVERDTIYEDLAKLFKDREPGDLIRISNIHFYRNKEQVIPQSQPLLQQLYDVMAANPKLSIEIHGHICCNPNPYDTSLSYRRAKFIFTYLLKKGIPLNRLAYMGFGSSDPIYPIPEKTHWEQIANRRVEILIIRN